MPALFTYIHEFLALLRFLPAADRRETLSEDGQGPPRLRCRSEAQTLRVVCVPAPFVGKRSQRERSRRVAALVYVMVTTRAIPERTEELAWVLAALYGVNQLKAIGQWLVGGRSQPPTFPQT